MDDMTGEALRAMNAQVCGMEDGIVSLTVDGSTITAVDAEDGTVFAHEYTYVDTVENAIEGAPMFVFRTDDADAGAFAQFRPLRAGGVYEIIAVREDREMTDRKDE